MPGFVPVTLTDKLTPTSPVIVLPELGDAKHSVIEYAPEGGVLVEQVETGGGVEVGVAVGLSVGVGLGAGVGVRVAVGVGCGVCLGFE